MESWPPTITGSGVTQETGKHAMAELLRQSLSDYISQRSIPPLTMKFWMNHKFPTNFIVEVASKLTAQDDMERTPPNPEADELPEPVRLPSGPASSLFPLPLHGTDTTAPG